MPTCVCMIITRPCQRCGSERPPRQFLFCSLQCRIKHYSVPTETGCWAWQQALDVYGYGRTNVGSKYIKAHRAAYEAFVGPIPKGKVICHRCDNRACVNPDHLFAGTFAENSADMVSKGRQTHGEARSKLTVAQVLAIRADPRKHSVVAPEYGVTRTLIRVIRERKVWRHV